MIKDLNSKLSVSSLLIPATRTADANATSIDLQLHESNILAVYLGDSGDTLSGSVKIECELEHSDDNSSFSDCADTDLSAAVTGTNTGTFAVVDAPAEDSAIFKVMYKGSKRYVRVVLNFTGTHTNGCPCAVFSIRGDGELNPQS